MPWTGSQQGQHWISNLQDHDSSHRSNLATVRKMSVRAVSPSVRLLASTGMKANSRPTMQSCKMSVPMVIWPCWELVALASVRHLTTMEVDDIDTCTSLLVSTDHEIEQERHIASRLKVRRLPGTAEKHSFEVSFCKNAGMNLQMTSRRQSQKFWGTKTISHSCTMHVCEGPLAEFVEPQEQN